MNDDDRRDHELLERAAATLERELDGLDADTRRRLTTARQAALAELAPRGADARGSARGWTRGWAPLGAAAAVTVVAVGVALALRGAPDATPSAIAIGGAEPATELELLLDEDDPALFADDPAFYEWAAEQAAGGDGAG